MSFFELLDQRVVSVNSLLCIGLDPHSSQLNENTVEAAINFCVDIIIQTHEYAAAFKPNIAFFEAFGEDGIKALNKVISCIPTNIPIILDCKRGDIDSTAQAYAQACFNIDNVSAVTLSPYLGWDSVKPFLTGKYSGKGAFVLCKTSNPSSKELQEMRLTNGLTVFEHVANLCNEWNKCCDQPSIGLVAGATDIQALEKVRKRIPDTWILCPGVGAQGGEAMSVCKVGLRSDASGLLVSVSRGISSVENKAEAARILRDQINSCRQQFLAAVSSTEFSGHETLENYQREFIDFAITNNVLKFGSFTLKSGRQSPYFFNAGLFDNGSCISQLGGFYAQAIRKSGIQFDIIFGPAYKGIPLATTVAISWYHLYGENKYVTFNRKEVKDHGEGGNLIGASMKDKRVLIVDDVITAGTAIRESVNILNQSQAQLVGVVVCLDRQEKVTESSNESAIQNVEKTVNVPVISIVRLRNLIAYLSTTNTNGEFSQYLPLIQQYRSTYGVDY